MLNISCTQQAALAWHSARKSAGCLPHPFPSVWAPAPTCPGSLGLPWEVGEKLEQRLPPQHQGFELQLPAPLLPPEPYGRPEDLLLALPLLAEAGKPFGKAQGHLSYPEERLCLG